MDDATEVPTMSPTHVVDFDSLMNGLFVPTSSPVAAGGPTRIPTEFPIGPPPDFDGPSDDATDHWYCGIGIDDANAKCEYHCPTSVECPMGHICYFGTGCDARTHEPTPPPTRRPTQSPTTSPPTISFEPTGTPTISRPPTYYPTILGPTKSPSLKPTGKPTHAPLTSIQQGFFCGTSWQDVTSLCKKRCPSGEDPECPGDETCFAYTGCTAEKGYGKSPSKWIAGYDEWGNSMADYVSNMMKESEAFGFANDNGGGYSGGDGDDDDEPLCRQAEITITADNWPQETTWRIVDVETGNSVIIGNNDDLIPNEPISFPHCLPSWACYQFTINDDGGDGLCCEHGEGMYRVRYDGEVIKAGAAFYDEESVEFGCPTSKPTEEPTPKPTSEPTSKPTFKPVKSQTMTSNVQNVMNENKPSSTSSSGAGSASNSQSYRCVANPLVKAGYQVSLQFCDKFVDCYNQYIEMGDDWFCEEGEGCIEAEVCGGGGGVTVVGEVVAPAADNDEASVEEIAVVEAPSKPQPTPSRPANSAAKPEPATSIDAGVAAPIPTNKPSPMPTAHPATAMPSAHPTTMSPTESPTEIPTMTPTTGPCGGDPCPISSYCRSKYGFCGKSDSYCTDTAIWTTDCPPKEESTPLDTPYPSVSPVVASSGFTFGDVFPSSSGSSMDDASITPVPVPVVAFQKPSGGSKPKPSGGKGSASKPSTLGMKVPSFQTRSPSTRPPASMPTAEPTKTKPLTSVPTTTSMPTEELETFYVFGTPTHRPTPVPAEGSQDNHQLDYVNLSTHSSNLAMMTNDPTPRPTKKADTIQANSASMSASTVTTSKVEENEYTCTGEPCQDQSWCRSRYGSCGPGFIYCNSYSAWHKSCPAVVPGTRPTRSPTPKPTREPTTVYIAIASEPSAPIVPSAPAFPALPKPTLPTIMKGSVSSSANFISQSSAAHSGGQSIPSAPDGEEEGSWEEVLFEMSDSKNTNGEEVDDAEIVEKEEDEEEEEEDLEPNVDDNNNNSTKQPPVEDAPGMEQWLDFTNVRNKGTTCPQAWHFSSVATIFAFWQYAVFEQCWS